MMDSQRKTLKTLVELIGAVKAPTYVEFTRHSHDLTNMFIQQLTKPTQEYTRRDDIPNASQFEVPLWGDEIPSQRYPSLLEIK